MRCVQYLFLSQLTNFYSIVGLLIGFSSYVATMDFSESDMIVHCLHTAWCILRYHCGQRGVRMIIKGVSTMRTIGSTTGGSCLLHAVCIDTASPLAIHVRISIIRPLCLWPSVIVFMKWLVLQLVHARSKLLYCAQAPFGQLQRSLHVRRGANIIMVQVLAPKFVAMGGSLTE